MNIAEISARLAGVLGEENVIENADMALHTSFRAGGRADLLVVPQSMDQLRYTLYLLGGSADKCGGCCGGGCACGEEIPYMLIGNGSNLLVRGGGYRGALVKLGGEFREVAAEGEFITAGGAALMSAVAKLALDSSLSGFEFASGIPGSVGGGAFMNAGAYGGELREIIYSIQAISKDGTREYMKFADELEFGYRHSEFCETGDIITRVSFRLKKGIKEEISEKMKALAAARNSKQPVNLPSAGSFFKRPTGHFAGALIEEAGLKGLALGAAQVSSLHAGFIVNNGGAAPEEILGLMRLVQNTVYDRTGIMLEPEVRIIGED